MTTSDLVKQISEAVRRTLPADSYWGNGLPVVVQDGETFFEPWVTVRSTESGPVLVLVGRHSEDDWDAVA